MVSSWMTPARRPPCREPSGCKPPPEQGHLMNLIGLALRNLRRRPIRTSLSILGIGLAVGSALALIALSRSIQDSTRDGMDELGDDLVVMQKGASDIFGGFIPEPTVGRI